MAEFYERFIQETFDDGDRLLDYAYHYGENYNYAYDVLDVMAGEEPYRLAMLWRNDQGQEKHLTFADFRKLSNQAANLFKSRGLQKGDVLLSALRTHWEYWVVALAAHKLGLILAPAYYRLTENDFFYRLDKTKARCVVTCREGEAAEHIWNAAERAGVPIRFALGQASDGFDDFNALLEHQPDTLDRVETDAHDPMAIYFTSGTTGEPKAIVHDHAYTLANHCGGRYMQDNHADSRHFATGDSGWEILAGTKFYCQWLCRSTLLVYDYDRFSPEKILEFLQETKATSVMTQPVVYRKFVQLGMNNYDLSSVTCFAVGGDKLPPDLAESVYEQTGCHLYEGYAQSETGLIAAASKNMGHKKGSVGKILPKYHVELLKDDGSFAQPDELGEIVIVADEGVRPNGLMMGYYGDPEATQSLWDGNLFRTGDLALKDADNFLFYRGRSNGLIKTKGYRVSPIEIETLLSQHPAVKECVAVGVPHPDLGQSIQAYVKLTDGFSPTETLKQDLLTFHNSQCVGFKKIRDLRFLQELPRNANGKLIREPLKL